MLNLESCVEMVPKFWGDWLLVLLITIYILMFVIYLCNKQWVKALYWLGAIFLNVAVLIGMKSC